MGFLEIKTWPQDITIDDYCRLYGEYNAIGIDAVYSLQRQLVMRLTEKEKKDFFTYVYRCQHNYDDRKIRRPTVWVKISNCLPLAGLFTYSDAPEQHRLYKRYKNGDKAVLEFPFSKTDIIDDINKKQDWTFFSYYAKYHLFGRRAD